MVKSQSEQCGIKSYTLGHRIDGVFEPELNPDFLLDQDRNIVVSLSEYRNFSYDL